MFLPEDFELYLHHSELKQMICGEYLGDVNKAWNTIMVENDKTQEIHSFLSQFYEKLSYNHKQKFLSKISKHNDLAIIVLRYLVIKNIERTIIWKNALWVIELFRAQ